MRRPGRSRGSKRHIAMIAKDDRTKRVRRMIEIRRVRTKDDKSDRTKDDKSDRTKDDRE